MIRAFRHRTARHNRGAALSQYALVVGLIAILALFSITLLGQNVRSLFLGVSNRLGDGTLNQASSGNGSGNPAPASCAIDNGVDSAFLGSGTGSDNSIYALTPLGDGRIMIGGVLANYNGTARGRIARLNADASLDTSFLNTGAGASDIVWNIQPQSDGKYVIVGYFTSYNGTSRGRIARLNADGSLDTSFMNSLAGADNITQAIAIESNGKIMVGGYFSSINGTSRGRIARLNADGTVDTSFLASGAGAAGAGANIHQIEPVAGGYLISGVFTSYNGTARGNIARINSDGSLDTSFLNTGAGSDYLIRQFAVQPDGKIMIAGNFTSFNGVSRGSVARLNADGSLDTSFLNTGNGAGGNVYRVFRQSDGKYIIGGNFNAYNSVSRGTVARLNGDGSLDSGFLAGSGSNGSVLTAYIQNDGKPVFAGSFSTFNGVARGNLVRINCQ